MTIETSELKVGIQMVADRCDESLPEQAAIKSILYSLLGAIVVSQQLALCDHVCEFTRRQVAAMDDRRTQTDVLDADTIG